MISGASDEELDVAIDRANFLLELQPKIDELKKENQQLKAQYCERTDCSGRIGNSKKVEELETEKEQLNSLVNSCQEEIRRLKKELQALKVSEEEWLEKSDK